MRFKSHAKSAKFAKNKAPALIFKLQNAFTVQWLGFGSQECLFLRGLCDLCV